MLLAIVAFAFGCDFVNLFRITIKQRKEGNETSQKLLTRGEKQQRANEKPKRNEDG